MQKPRAADSVEIFGCVFAVGAVAIWLRPLTGQKWKGFGFGSLWVGAFPLPSAEMSPPVCCRQTRSDEMFETQTAALISVTAGRTTLGPFVLLLLSWQRRVIDEVFSLQTVQRRVTLNRVQHQGVW